MIAENPYRCITRVGGRVDERSACSPNWKVAFRWPASIRFALCLAWSVWRHGHVIEVEMIGPEECPHCHTPLWKLEDAE